MRSNNELVPLAMSLARAVSTDYSYIADFDRILEEREEKTGVRNEGLQ